jgi:hypothetical protein
MVTAYVNNLISLVADAVNQIHRSAIDLEFIEAQLHMRTDLYGELQEDVINHIGAVLCGILRQKEQDDYDDYYSVFDLQ